MYLTLVWYKSNNLKLSFTHWARATLVDDLFPFIPTFWEVHVKVIFLTNWDLHCVVCIRCDWRVLRALGISLLNVNTVIQVAGSLLLIKPKINSTDWYSYLSRNLRTRRCWKMGSVWLLNFALCIIRRAHSCKMIVWPKIDWATLSQARKPYDKWERIGE